MSGGGVSGVRSSGLTSSLSRSLSEVKDGVVFSLAKLDGQILEFGPALSQGCNVVTSIFGDGAVLRVRTAETMECILSATGWISAQIRIFKKTLHT